MTFRLYAFYSNKQANLCYNVRIRIGTEWNSFSSNIYRLEGSYLEVKATELCRVEKNNINEYLENHKSRFSDSEYLGVVDKWLRSCK